MPPAVLIPEIPAESIAARGKLVEVADDVALDRALHRPAPVGGYLPEHGLQPLDEVVGLAIGKIGVNAGSCGSERRGLRGPRPPSLRLFPAFGPASGRARHGTRRPSSPTATAARSQPEHHARCKPMGSPSIDSHQCSTWRGPPCGSQKKKRLSSAMHYTTGRADLNRACRKNPG